MSLLLSTLRILRESRGGKDVLPAPFPIRIGIFPFQSERKIHTAEAIGKILLVLRLNFQKMEDLADGFGSVDLPFAAIGKILLVLRLNFQKMALQRLS